ncbi:hypothetical protein ScPMuIL_016141 [Solemya velum]
MSSPPQSPNPSTGEVAERCLCGGPWGHQWAPNSQCLGFQSDSELEINSDTSKSEVENTIVTSHGPTPHSPELFSDESDSETDLLTASNNCDSTEDSWNNDRLPPSLVAAFDTTSNSSGTSSGRCGHIGQCTQCSTIVKELKAEIARLQELLSEKYGYQRCPNIYKKLNHLILQLIKLLPLIDLANEVHSLQTDADKLQNENVQLQSEVRELHQMSKKDDEVEMMETSLNSTQKELFRTGLAGGRCGKRH